MKPKIVIHNHFHARARDESGLPPGISRDPATGEFAAGGRTAAQHAKTGEHHLKVGKASETRLEARGERSKRLGRRSEAWNKGQQHQLAGSHHKQAAEHLSATPPRFKEAVRSARLAEHHKPKQKTPHPWEPSYNTHKEKEANLKKNLGLPNNNLGYFENTGR